MTIPPPLASSALGCRAITIACLVGIGVQDVVAAETALAAIASMASGIRR